MNVKQKPKLGPVAKSWKLHAEAILRESDFTPKQMRSFEACFYAGAACIASLFIQPMIEQWPETKNPDVVLTVLLNIARDISGVIEQEEPMVQAMEMYRRARNERTN